MDNFLLITFFGFWLCDFSVHFEAFWALLGYFCGWGARWFYFYLKWPKLEKKFLNLSFGRKFLYIWDVTKRVWDQIVPQMHVSTPKVATKLDHGFSGNFGQQRKLSGDEIALKLSEKCCFRVGFSNFILKLTDYIEFISLVF